MQNINMLVYLTEALFKQGLDYRVTLTGTTKVELLDNLTNRILDVEEAETLEQALSTILARSASNSIDYNQKLSVL